MTSILLSSFIICSAAFFSFPDCNNNGIDDAQDVANCENDPRCADFNDNGVPDLCDYHFDPTVRAFTSYFPESMIEAPEGFPPGILIGTLDTSAVVLHYSPETDTVSTFSEDGLLTNNGIPLMYGSVDLTAAPNAFGHQGPRVFVANRSDESDPWDDVTVVNPDGTVSNFARVMDQSWLTGIEYIPMSIGGPHAGKLVAVGQTNTSDSFRGALYTIDSFGVVSTIIPDLVYGAFTVHLAPPDFGDNGSKLFIGHVLQFGITTFDLLTNDVAVFANVEALPVMPTGSGTRQIAFSPKGWFRAFGEDFVDESFLVVSISGSQLGGGSGGILAVVDALGNTVLRYQSLQSSPPFDPRGLLFDGDRLLIANFGGEVGSIQSISALDFDPRDCNGNGSLDTFDVLACDGQKWCSDCNSNDIPDGCEPDCNQDGAPDACVIADCGGELACADCNENGVPDMCDFDDATSVDCNTNHVPDECEPDCDQDGIIDECALNSGQESDCNSNGIPDSCDIRDDVSLDCNSNSEPDECELDCNGNGVPDECDISVALEEDCNGNGIPDSCDLRDGTSVDIDGDGLIDDCDTFLPIPTVSQWGLAALTLLLMITAKLAFRRRVLV